MNENDPKGERERPPEPPWRFEVAPALPASRWFNGERDLGEGWQKLVLLHTPFRATDQREYRQLVDSYWALERIFLERESLGAYYRECNAGSGADNRAAPSREISHVATLQALLMEDVYYILQLERYANAPDNRGWMNLFRRWGQSPTFNGYFDEMRPTLTEEFVRFYEDFLRGYTLTVDQYPIPHPWDGPARRLDPRTLGLEDKCLRGVFLDSGIREVEPFVRAGRPDQGPAGAPDTGAHTVGDAKGGAKGYEQPPSADREEGSSGSNA